MSSRIAARDDRDRDRHAALMEVTNRQMELQSRQHKEYLESQSRMQKESIDSLKEVLGKLIDKFRFWCRLLNELAAHQLRWHHHRDGHAAQWPGRRQPKHSACSEPQTLPAASQFQRGVPTGGGAPPRK